MTLETAKRSKKNWRISKTPGFAYVEKMFFYYPRIVKRIEEVKSEQGYYQSGRRDGGGSSNRAFISDPTFQIASKHLGKIERISLNNENISKPEDWIVVVEKTFEHFPDNDIVGRILRKRYLVNEPMPKTCIRYDLTYSKYYRLRDVGINYARECAIQIGVIKVFEY